ncbi:hypothetical protein [Ruegeria lacuscaerulensis]|uniref:hypothetical protein n=1 Tax=Ruegeria lacuscaerulensis TaxID=55218 RepID=UPI00147C8BCC|nr:hypothetical protein [Ruegeria lacuscaerulensis]
MQRFRCTALICSTSIAMASDAQSFERCEPFSVHWDQDQVTVTFIDHGAEGQDIGDRRISTGPLRTEDGKVIGEGEAETVVVNIDDNGKARMTSEVILHLPGGAIMYKAASAPTVRTVDDTTGPVNASRATRMIIAGSGEFSGARGEVEVTRGDGTSRLDILISCD